MIPLRVQICRFTLATALAVSAASVIAQADRSASHVPTGADADLLAQGARAFARRCASCHGETATDGASGDIRGLSHKIIASAVRGFDQMPKVSLRPGETEAIAAWLAAAGDEGGE